MLLKYFNFNTTTAVFKETKLNIDDVIYLVGRHSACNIKLPDENKIISNTHGIFLYKANSWYYRDISSNGSLVNNQPVQNNEQIALKKGDVITICDWIVVVKDIEETEETSQNVGESWTGEENLLVRCVGVINETRDLKTFRFVSASKSITFNYQPGQYVVLCLNIDGQEVYRSYTISSSPTRPKTLEITVKRVEGTAKQSKGLVSNWLHDNIKIGSEITISGPHGEFSCSNNPHAKLMFISAGSGITPMISMLRWAYDCAPHLDIIFVYTARTKEDLCFDREISSICQNNPNFKYVVSLTDPSVSDWTGHKGRLDRPERIQDWVPDFLERAAYLCGPDDFMKTVKNLLANLQFPIGNFYQESFSPPKPPRPVGPPKPPSETVFNNQVLFSQSQKEINCIGEETILEVAEREKIKLKNACKVGICGTCLIKKLEGEVNYKEVKTKTLTDKQKKDGLIFACVAYTVGRVVIDA